MLAKIILSKTKVLRMILAFLLLKFYEEGKSPLLYQACYFEALKVYVTGIFLFVQRNLPRSKALVDSLF